MFLFNPLSRCPYMEGSHFICRPCIAFRIPRAHGKQPRSLACSLDFIRPNDVVIEVNNYKEPSQDPLKLKKIQCQNFINLETRRVLLLLRDNS